MSAEAEKLAVAFRHPSVSEILINPDGSVYAERGPAGLEKLPIGLAPGDAEIFVKTLVGQEERFGPQRPYADLSALDGSRLHVIGPPLVRGGLCVTVRKRPAKRMSLPEMVAAGSLTQPCADFLSYAVSAGQNLLLVGGTSSGKTSLLNALAGAIDPKSRILVLEDTPELAFPQPHVMYLSTRARDPQGLADVTLRDLVVNTLRMRPDRIIVGEVRGPEAADLLEAMNVGHEGILCTMHANSPREALQRLETLVMLAGGNLPLKAVRSNIVLAVDLIVSMARLSDGSRRVVQVSEVTGMEIETINMSDLFVLDARQPGAALRPSGTLPRFYDQLRRGGVEPPLEFFRGAA